ncbi:MAG: hypothetical protein HPY89_01035 [Pelotomaculum sp.]|uniref:Hypothetical membrane protein n=1 Tax=Pelotomaculum thermopropionicum (strain DSM 13744 / JCM 10971 / SI) TaxID=370438 RepID=A5D331_PELTS|nr:hypothetical protein [Pelotomaculum sp.]BAF59372.1 hypothetical membrane protein [Pelotomaculum thermopropionicum SI]
MEEKSSVSVKINIADAGPAGWISYSIATWMAWAFLCGYVNNKALIFMSAVSLACTIPYLGAAITQLKLGNLAGGVTWLYFGSFFAFASALNYGISYFAGVYKWELDSRILGYEWLILGIVLILTTPIFARHAPAAATISVIGADVGIVTLALIYWGLNLSLLSGWSFFVAGLFGIIMAAGGILEGAGMKFPMGRPLFK